MRESRLRPVARRQPGGERRFTIEPIDFKRQRERVSNVTNCHSDEGAARRGGICICRHFRSAVRESRFLVASALGMTIQNAGRGVDLPKYVCKVHTAIR